MTITNINNLFKIGNQWPPESELSRLTTYTTNQRLFEGKHDLVFNHNSADETRKKDIVTNWHKRICTLFADLVVGSPPDFTAENQPTMDRITNNNKMDILLYNSVIHILKYGNAVLKIRYDERAKIDLINPGLWFPVISPDNKAEVESHVIAWTFSENGTDYLTAEIHRKGSIENRLYVMKDGKISNAVELSTIERYKDIPDSQKTGVNDFLVIPLTNIGAESVVGTDDFTDINGLIKELENRLIRTSRTLDKFSDPNIVGSEASINIDPDTGESDIEIGGGRFIPIGEDGTAPYYLVWDAKLEASFKQIEVILSELYIMSETSAACFSDLKTGLAESGSALKRLLMPTLAKVNRLKIVMEAPLKDVLRTAADIEIASKLSGATKLENISIDWRSSLPVDMKELVDIETQRVNYRLTSKHSSLKRLNEGASEADIEAELAAIDGEQSREFGFMNLEQ